MAKGTLSSRYYLPLGALSLVDARSGTKTPKDGV